MTREEIVSSMSLKDAIQVLKDTNCYGTMDIAKSVILKAFEQEPCDDAISREAVLEWLIDKDIIKTKNQEENARRELAELPSVTPQPKTGRWLEKEVNSDKVIEEWQSAKCSVCNKYHTTPYMYYFSKYNYCPNCGARMEVTE